VSRHLHDFSQALSCSNMKNRIYRFAQFELNLAESKLRSGDSIVLIQEKPLLLLSALLDNPQRLVTREQLRDRMWDSRTVVNYEQGINVAIKKVRQALGDAADNPKLIETVAKKGYRLMVPVTWVSDEDFVREMYPPSPIATAPPIASVGVAGRSGGRALLYSIIAAAMVCALAAGLYGNRTRPRRIPRIGSLAVLPLQNLSPDSGQDYFADGITEEVITNLAQTLPLRVISRSSVMRYKRTEAPVAQIARELGVDAIVEGSVARSGDRVSITVQLIAAAEDRHLWAQTYERNLADILSIEAEVSHAIAGMVGGTLGLKQAGLTSTHPVDPRVYELCLLGRFHWNKHTGPDMRKAEDYYQQAIARDPGYAPAYAGLANIYVGFALHGLAPFRPNLDKAVVAARRALELDESLADAHATLGLVDLYNPEWTRSEPEFRQAIELDRNNVIAHDWLAYYLFFANRRDEALTEIALAQQLDPLSPSTNADEGHFLYAARHFDEARAKLKRAIELAPEFGEPHATLALIDLESGHHADALKEARTALELDPNNARVMGEAGYVLASTEHATESRELLTVVQDVARRGPSTPVFAAMIEIGLGQRDRALDTLARMVDSGDRLEGLVQWHAFDELSADSRFKKLLANKRD
jgi:TolB-like protein/DNA-binding winged helix-turn-helix (wHTH) protein/Tfp pilus assembly protein PilF